MNENKNKLYCITPPPLLYILNTCFMLLVPWLAALLGVFLVINILRNRKKRVNILDKKVKTYILWIITFIIYLIVSYICYEIDSGYLFYIISPLTLFVLLLVNLLIAKKYTLFRVKFVYILFTLILIILLSKVAFTNISEWLVYRARSIEFEKTMLEIPKFPLIEKETYSYSAVNYSISKDSLGVIDFYKSNLSALDWELMHDTGSQTDQYSAYGRSRQLVYKKNNEDKWLKLVFLQNSKDDAVTSVFIYFYITEPFIGPEFINPLLMGDCDGFRLW
jgi:hypothetical protein